MENQNTLSTTKYNHNSERCNNKKHLPNKNKDIYTWNFKTSPLHGKKGYQKNSL